MVDHSKRETLKNVARVSAGIAIGSISGNAAANSAMQPGITKVDDHDLPFTNHELAELEITTRLSSNKNDLEVVITNKGASTANITDMTPAQINSPRGTFDFNALFNEGAVSLKAGQSVSIPLQRHPVSVSSSANIRTFPLSKSLKQNISIITDGDSLAAVSFGKSAGQLV